MNTDTDSALDYWRVPDPDPGKSSRSGYDLNYFYTLENALYSSQSNRTSTTCYHFKKHSTVFFVQLKQKRRIFFLLSIWQILRIRIQKKIHNTGYHNILWNARGPLELCACLAEGMTWLRGGWSSSAPCWARWSPAPCCAWPSCPPPASSPGGSHVKR